MVQKILTHPPATISKGKLMNPSLSRNMSRTKSFVWTAKTRNVVKVNFASKRFFFLYQLKNARTNRPTDPLNVWMTDILSDWLIDYLTDRLTDWLSHWPTGWMTDWPTARVINWLTDWLTDCPIDLPTNCPTYRLTNQLTNWWPDRLTEGLIDDDYPTD